MNIKEAVKDYIEDFPGCFRFKRSDVADAFEAGAEWQAEQGDPNLRLGGLKRKALEAFLECEGYDEFEREINSLTE